MLADGRDESRTEMRIITIFIAVLFVQGFSGICLWLDASEDYLDFCIWNLD